MRNHSSPFILWAALSLGAIGAFGQSQAANGIIEVVVLDSSRSVIPGATVALRNTENGFSRSILSNDAGQATALLLPLGTYEIQASASGFASVRIAKVLLQVGQRRTIEVSLKASSISETITVSEGDVPIIETQRVNSAERLDDRAVHSLPTLARDFKSFVTLTPGTLSVTRGDASAFSIGGQKGIHSGITVDGADFSNSFFGGQLGGPRPPFTISLEAIKEFVVQTNGLNPEFGRSGGGMMNAVTKSGTNSIHGSGFWYLQDRTFIRDDYFDRAARGRRQQFGATLGGPIRKNKLFFFVANDNQKRNAQINLAFNALPVIQAAANGSDPVRADAAKIFLTRQGQLIAGDNVASLVGKVDWLINSTTTLSSRYNFARNRQNNGTYGLSGQQAAGAENFGIEKNDVDGFNTQVSKVFSARLFNEFRYNMNREDRPRITFPYPESLNANGVAGGSNIVINGLGRLGPPATLPIVSLEWRNQFTDNVTLQTGRHEIKFGGGIDFVKFDNVWRGNARGQFTFFSFDTFAARQPDQYIQFFGPGAAVLKPTYPSLFAQDTFRLRPGLTLMYGLRWDGQTNPAVKTPNQDFLGTTSKIPNDLMQFSPRVGLAWSPGKSGKNVFRYYAAYLYAPVPTLIWANVLFQNGDVANGYNYFADRATNPAGIPAFNYPFGGPYPTPFQTNPAPLSQTSGTVPGGQVNMVDRNFHNPRITRTNATYERALASSLTVSATVDYAFTTGNMRRKDLNLFAPTAHPVTGRMTYDRSRRPFPFASNVISREATSVNRYSAATFSVNKRFSRGFSAQGFYTLASSKSDDDNENSCCSQDGVDQFNYRPDWGRSNLDIRHNFVANAVMVLPGKIEFSPILRIQSGRPFNTTTGSDLPTAFALSPAALTNFRNYIGQPNATIFGGGNGDTSNNDRPLINGAQLARNAFEQPGYFRVDARVGRTIRFGERKQLNIGVDVFNLFNNANLFTTNTQINNAAFGALNNADDPLAIQTVVKFSW